MYFFWSRVFVGGVVVHALIGNAVMAQVVSADNSAMTILGPSGGLTIPNGRVLADGDAALGWNNHIESKFSQAKNGNNYLFGMGVFPYMELSGKLVNYAANGSPDFLLRDLSANVKVAIPQFFRLQPDIAVGVNDLAGGAASYRSKYAVASQRLGPLYATVGAARGESYFNGLFGGVEMALGSSGFSALAERNSHVNYAGIRYTSAPMANFGNASFVATVQRSIGASASDGSKFDRTVFGINLVVPFGNGGGNNRAGLSFARKGSVVKSEPIWTPPPGYDKPALHTTPQASTLLVSEASTVTSTSVLAPVVDVSNTSEMRGLQKLQIELEKAGLERVRVGLADRKLLIEYENHRYNRNEVDAIGIALALGARLSPGFVTRMGVITKKAGAALYEVSVDRNQYRNFLNDGDYYGVREEFEVRRRPVADASVQWFSPEGKHGASRIVIAPVIKHFVGTEVGVYDYSLATSMQGLAPLWKGAEVSANYVANVADSENVRSGGVFAYAHQRSGLASAALSQSFWLNENLLNVVSGGKFLYDYWGVQNEAIWFVPGRDDQVRVRYTQVKTSDPLLASKLVHSNASYRWSYQPLNLWVELGYSKYVENDKGPSVRFSRWFGDVQAQAYMLRSERASFVGFQLAFPLTPRKGMKTSSYTHIEGPGQFVYGLKTKLANQGDCNCITRGIAEEIPIAYSADTFLLNQGRVGRNYLLAQLPRMREAALLFASSNP